MYKFITSPSRSLLMSKIRSKNTKPEVALQRKLWGRGIRFSKNSASFPGKPDIAIQKYKIAIFVDGEFWHGYKWVKKRRLLKSNRRYWLIKIESNMRRDKVNNRALRKMGWYVARFWQHRLETNMDLCVNKICELVEARKNETV